MDPGLEGRVVRGRFELQERIGRGGQCEVRAAWDRESWERVAVRFLLRPTPHGRRRFELEARTLMRLPHPSLPRVHDFGETEEGTPYMATDLVMGTGLLMHADSALRIRGAEGLPAAVRPFVALADALEHLHRHGVLHQDVKPGNVRVHLDGRPVLIDFGQSRLGPSDRTPHAKGQVVGTPLYMAPEQLDARPEKLGPWTDLYQLGATMYHALTRRPPFNGTLPGLLSAIRASEPTPPSQLNPAIGPYLEGVILRCMRKVPSRRFQGAAQVSDCLQRWLGRARVAGALLRSG